MSVPPSDKPSLHVKAARDLGMTLFPVVAREKRPRDKDWQTREYTWDEVRNWYNQSGNLGVRIAADHVILDIDPRRDQEGRTADEIFMELEIQGSEHGWPVATAPRVRTGSGGLHVYFKGRPPGVRKAWSPALEVKLAGQLVVAPGSVHPNGNRYLWERIGPIPDLPAAMAALLFQPDTQREHVVAEFRSPEYVADSLALLDPANFRDYEEWRNLLFACHSATQGSDEGLEAFIDWSTSDPQYAGAAEDVRAIWHAARAGGRTAASLDHAVREAGHTPLCERVEVEAVPDSVPIAAPKGEAGKTGKQGPKTLRKPRMEDIKKALLDTGFVVKRNVLTSEAAVTWPVMKLRNRPLDRELECKILVTGLLEKVGLRWKTDPTATTLRAVIEDVMVDVDPRLDWAKTLRWDGEERIETWLLDVCNLEDTRYHRAVSRYILEAGMARLRAPGTKADMVPVLTGPQGCGKSRFVDRLALGRWAGTWQIENMGVDGVRVCHRAWVLEIAEIGASRFGKLEALKDFLTRTHDEFRMPYDRDITSKGRAFIFIGTTNEDQYLIDSSGNRRFLPLAVDAIDVDMMIDGYVEQLWAEAYAKYQPTPLVTIDSSLWSVAAQYQEAAYAEDPWEEAIGNYVQGKDNPGRAIDVYTEALSRVPTSATRPDLIRVGRILRRLGFKKNDNKRWVPPHHDVPLDTYRQRVAELGYPDTIGFAQLDTPGQKCNSLDVAKVLRELGYEAKRTNKQRYWIKVAQEK